MQTKFTPGPYHVKAFVYEGRQRSVEVRGPAVKGNSAGLIIATSMSADDESQHVCFVATEEEAMANARLLAAAPSLLDALAEATDALSGGLWDYGPGQTEHERCNEVIARCRAVLAKAIEYTPAQEAA